LREQHEKTTNTEYSLNDHIIDYELRRVKERRAHEEILSGRYRQPAFIASKLKVTFVLFLFAGEKSAWWENFG
jgi:hypothetical protein